jgi:hypothetical protein
MAVALTMRQGDTSIVAVARLAEAGNILTTQESSILRPDNYQLTEKSAVCHGRVTEICSGSMLRRVDDVGCP